MRYRLRRYLFEAGGAAVRMSKTQAAEILATDVRVWARKAGVPVTKSLVEERMSELGCGAPQYAGTLKEQAALTRPSWRTILRAATKYPL